MLIIIEYLRVHQLASYNYPIPWVDESDILWRAITFAETESFSHVPQLHLFWHAYNRVPGYIIFMGALFKLCGFSLHFARSVSCALVIASFLLLACMTARHRFRILSLLILGFYLLSEPFVATGNVGRMEALLLFVVCLGFLLLQRQRHREGFAVLLVAPLIHPNGLFFLLSGVAYLLVARLVRVRQHPLSRSDAAFLLVSVGLWCAYAFYVANHWPEHQGQMANQIRQKLSRDIAAGLFTASNGVLMVATLLCGVYSVTKRLEAGFLLLLAIPAWLVYAIWHEIWYQVFSCLFYALFSIVGMQVVAHLVDQIIVSVMRPIGYAVAAGLTAIFVLWNPQGDRLDRAVNYPWSMAARLRMKNDVPYLNDADVAAVGTFLDALRSPARPLQVRFYPQGDSLLFQSWDGRGLRFSQYFFPTAGDEVFIIHTSKALPPWMRQEARELLRTTSTDQSATPRLLRERDGTEAWYYQPHAGQPG